MYPSMEETSLALDAAKKVTYALLEFLEHFKNVSYGTRRNSATQRHPSLPTNGRPRVNKVKPFPETSGRAGIPMPPHPNHPKPQPGSLQPALGPLKAPNQLQRHHPPIQRPCASVQPTRILGNASPIPLQVPQSPYLTGPSHLPSIQPHHVPAPGSLGQVGESMEALNDRFNKSLHLQPMPTEMVPAIILGAPMAPPPSALPQMAAAPGPGTQGAMPMAAVPPPPPLISDDDQFIPFADGPFVSKYGPISRLNIVNTPTVAQNSNTQNSSSQTLRNHTQPTNVILGRSALPSLTVIQHTPFMTMTLIPELGSDVPPPHLNQMNSVNSPSVASASNHGL